MMRANPVYRSCLILYPRYVFSLCDVENDCSTVTVTVGKVANIGKNHFTFRWESIKPFVKWDNKWSNKDKKNCKLNCTRNFTVFFLWIR